MLTYAARAVPWLRVAMAAGLVLVLMQLVHRNPWVLWPLEGTAVGLLAGATAWCFDETAAVIVDAAPRSLAWRAAARSPAVLLLAFAWGLAVIRVGSGAGSLHVEPILVQGLVAIATGAAFACWHRAQGEAVPGLRFATALVPAVTVWALVRPFDERLDMFPYGSASMGWRNPSTIAWLTIGAAASLILIAALADAAWWRIRSASTAARTLQR